MPRPRKKVVQKIKKAHKIRRVLSDNVRHMMDFKFAKMSDRTRALANAAHVSLSTVQRILDGASEVGVGTSVDNVGRLADVFKVKPHELLIPKFHLRVTDSYETESDDQDAPHAGQPEATYLQLSAPSPPS